MSQISFSEWYEDVKNRQRVAEGILTKRALKENYDPKDWDRAKITLSNIPFPDKKFKEDASGAHRINAGESHESGKEFHGLATFELKDDIDDFPLVWRFSYCPQCKKVINKFGAVANNYESSAYRRWYVRNGNLVGKDSYEPEEKEEKVIATPRKQHFEKVLDSFSTLGDSDGGDLDGNA